MKLFDICQKANVNCPQYLKDLEVEGITSNSQKVKQNYLFVCLKGTKSDGHLYIDEAFENGALAVIVEDENYSCERSILVDSTREALANMMNVFCGEPTKKLKFIGVTGTNGKTSVSVMIKNIFDTIHIPCELIGTLNSSSFSEKPKISQANFTTPDPEELYPMLQRISGADVRYVVMEVSSHALKLKKLAPINFEIGIFTNLTEDHLDFHKSMEDYFKSKLCLFDKCKLGIINIDDCYGKQITSVTKCKIKTCSIEQNADYLAFDIENHLESGFEYKIKTQQDVVSMKCNIPAQFTIMNSMQACACALELNIDKNLIKRSFESLKNVEGRLEKIELFEGRGFAGFIDYAHTPDALSKLLDTANSFKKAGQRVILLFGCGGDREKEKRKIMGEIATKKADFTIITSDNPRSENPIQIINDILSGTCENSDFIVIPDRRKAIEYAIVTAKKGDIILFAGKGHEKYEINANGAFPFNEKEIIRDILKNTKGEMSYED